MLSFGTWGEAATWEDKHRPSHQVQGGISLIHDIGVEILKAFYIDKDIRYLAWVVHFVAQIATQQDEAQVDHLGVGTPGLRMDHSDQILIYQLSDQSVAELVIPRQRCLADGLGELDLCFVPAVIGLETSLADQVLGAYSAID